jgi:hypothetical protein
LPHGLLTNQSSNFVYVMEGLGMENFAVINGHLVHLMDPWHIFGHWVYFPPYWYV